MAAPSATERGTFGLDALERRLGLDFGDRRLLERALTHRSFSADHNERLEFLGDAVLNLAVAHLLFERLPHLPEGDLSRVRAHLVKQDTLHGLAERLGLSSWLRLGEGELRSGGAQRPSILADALEAVIGAVFLDAGAAAAHAAVRRLYEQIPIGADISAASKDAKTALQEWLQGRRMRLPVYRVVQTHGAAHQQIFEVECTVEDLAISRRGSAASRRAGEQVAAAQMLDHLRQLPAATSARA